MYNRACDMANGTHAEEPLVVRIKTLTNYFIKCECGHLFGSADGINENTKAGEEIYCPICDRLLKIGEEQ